MAIIDIDGKKLEVQEGFLALAPDKQQQILDTLMGKIGVKKEKKASWVDRNNALTTTGGIAGSGAGAFVGFKVGTALAPFTFGLSIPVLTAIGSVAGGALGGGVGENVEKRITNHMDPDAREFFSGLSPEQKEAVFNAGIAEGAWGIIPAAGGIASRGGRLAVAKGFSATKDWVANAAQGLLGGNSGRALGSIIDNQVAGRVANALGRVKDKEAAFKIFKTWLDDVRAPSARLKRVKLNYEIDELTRGISKTNTKKPVGEKLEAAKKQLAEHKARRAELLKRQRAGEKVDEDMIKVEDLHIKHFDNLINNTFPVKSRNAAERAVDKAKLKRLRAEERQMANQYLLIKEAENARMKGGYGLLGHSDQEIYARFAPEIAKSPKAMAVLNEYITKSGLYGIGGGAAVSAAGHTTSSAMDYEDGGTVSSAKISKIYNEGYTAPGQAFAIAQSMKRRGTLEDGGEVAEVIEAARTPDTVLAELPVGAFVMNHAASEVPGTEDVLRALGGIEITPNFKGVKKGPNTRSTKLGVGEFYFDPTEHAQNKPILDALNNQGRAIRRIVKMTGL